MMRKRTSIFLFLVLAVSFLFASSNAALADDDPPGRVARLNYIQGSVSFQPGGESDWVQANPNRPLTTGDNLWTDRNSRGELHIGSAVIRLSDETGISFLNLNDRTVQIQLAQGSMSIRLRRLDDGDNFEIDTPNLAFTVERPGEYRFDVDPNGQTTNLTVREGEGEATGGGSNFHMDSGESARVSGTDSLTFDVGRAGRPDGFDGWCSSRDDREEHARSARYVSRDVIGYEDLDDYGEWRSVPEYGTVWFPARVSPGWAPYRFGHWIWVEPWGWTWVEDEPWGFAPFHYGRWAVVGGGWCWVPGPVVVRPVYAPALVAFVGGPRFNLSISIGGSGGGVAWFPLGPREVYVPAYRASPRYVQNVNVTNTTVNVTNVTNVYNNVNVNNVTYMHQTNVSAVTAVSHDTFVNARPVAASNVRVNPQQLQAAEIQHSVAVAPVRQSIVGAAAPAAVRPSETVMKRQVVVKEAPPAPPVSFERQKQALSAQPGRVPAQQQMDQLRGAQVQQQQPAVKLAPPARGNQNPSQPGNAPPQQIGQQRGPQMQQQPPAGKFTPFGRGNQNASQPGNVPVQQQMDQQRGSQAQQQPPAGKFIPPGRGNQNASQPGNVPVQQQMDQQRGSQVQQQPPAGKFTPPGRGNQNGSQPGNVPAQRQMDQPRGSQVQQQPPAGKFTPPGRGNQDPSQPARVSQPQQTDQQRNPQQQQQLPVKVTPPAPPKAQSAPQKAPEHAQAPNKAADDSEKKQH
jgi:FecR protein